VRIARFASAGVYLLSLALGSLGLMSGCGGPETGTQVEVDMKAEEAQRKQMEQFYPSPSAKKTKGK
jgi:hypothetical protein